MENFFLYEEYLVEVPMWICHYSLPQESSEEETLGKFIKISEETRRGRYTYFSQIYVNMNVSNPFPKDIFLSFQYYEWIQTLEYEHNPFRCRKCLEYMHLYRDIPWVLASKLSIQNPIFFRMVSWSSIFFIKNPEN